MSLLQRIPLNSETTDQAITVELDGNPYILRVLWNEIAGYFSLSIYEADDTPILLNVKMVKNYNLTSRFKNTKLPSGHFFFLQEKAGIDRPGYNDLAVNFNLYYYEAD